MPNDLTLKLLITDLVQFRELLGALADWTVWAREQQPLSLSIPECALMDAVDALMAWKERANA